MTAMEYYVRAPTMGEAYRLQEKVANCFKAAATATGCTVNKCKCQSQYFHNYSNRICAESKQRRTRGKGISIVWVKMRIDFSYFCCTCLALTALYCS